MTRAGPALKFLLAARQSELQGLEQLAHTCALVTLVSELIHALQKERGYSNLRLCLRRDALARPLATLSELAQAREQNVRVFLDTMAGGGGRKARLLDRIAYALYQLDDLPDLRWRVREQRIGAQEASAGFTRLIANLLAVVFEAADTALDPDIAALLVALLNFIQGKELAGQERAFGVTGYTAGHFDAAAKAHMAELAAGQQRSFGTCARYAPAEIEAEWQAARTHDAPVERLRQMAQQTDPAQPTDPGLAELWFDLCTTRIDAMQPITARLTALLAARCRQRIAETQETMRDHRLLLERFGQPPADGLPAMLFSVQGRALDQPPADGLGEELERSLLDMLQRQTEKMQRADEALALARAALDEQKDVQRAKRWLMQSQRLSESEAHARLQRLAMESGLPLIAVARRLVREGQG